jgi:hypothetical protein
MPTRLFQTCLLTGAPKVPAGADWLREIKHDGYRLTAACEQAGSAWLNWTDRYSLIVEASLKNRSRAHVPIDDPLNGMVVGEAWGGPRVGPPNFAIKTLQWAPLSGLRGLRNRNGQRRGPVLIKVLPDASKLCKIVARSWFGGGNEKF